MNNPIFLMLVGLPASGKSTFAKKESIKFKIHSSDAMREKITGDINNQRSNQRVFDMLHKEIRRDLKNGLNVIYDATNISYKRRMAFLKEISDIVCDRACYVFLTPYEECLSRNQRRERVVPTDVIRKMYLNFDIPFYYEGWDFINIEYNGRTQYNESELLDTMINYDQKNPHHTLSLGDHCLKTFTHAHDLILLESTEIKDSTNIAIAGYYHDIGKLKTQTFFNSKGLPCEEAHYYNHERISAYDFMIYAKDHYQGDLGIREDILDIAQLIRWHMLYYNPDVLNNSKTKAKFTNLLGEEFLNRLYVLHLADKKAH